MANRMKLILALLGSAGAIAAVLGFQDKPPTPITNQPKPAVSISSAEAAHGAGAPIAAAATSSPEPAQPTLDKRVAQYREATDLRIFVEQAKRHPESGGALYAVTALFECALLRDVQLDSTRLAQLKQRLAADSSELTSQRSTALQWLEQRCAGFTSSEVSLSEEKFLRDWGQSKDALLALRSRVMNAGTPAEDTRRHLLGEVLETGEPLLLPLAQSLATAASDSGSVATYLDGKPYGGLDAEEFAAAWRLMSCQVTQSCATRDSQLMQQCAFEGKCAQSIQASIEASAKSPAEYQRIGLVAERLRQVVIARDPAPLLPPARLR